VGAARERPGQGKEVRREMAAKKKAATKKKKKK